MERLIIEDLFRVFIRLNFIERLGKRKMLDVNNNMSHYLVVDGVKHSYGKELT